MKRREMLHMLGSASAVGVLSNVLSTQIWAQDVRPFTVRGSGPALIVFYRQPRGFYYQLTDRYRVIVITDPAIDNSETNIASLTADRLCADILAVADAARVDRFRVVWVLVWQRCRPANCVQDKSSLRFCLRRLASIWWPIGRESSPTFKRKLRRVEPHQL